jgi:hypothetical protein
MSWFAVARNVISRWGTPARFAVRHVVAAAFPGGSMVGELLDRLLACAQQTAQDQQQAEAQARTIASDDELRRVAEVLGEVNGRLSNLMEQITHLDGLPQVAERLIRVTLATDETVRTGFANLAGIVGRFDRVEEQGREILRRIGYGNDVQETILELLHRQSAVVDFVEELRAAGVQPRQLGEMLLRFNDCLALARAGRAQEALPDLRAIEAERPESAAVQVALAAGASLANDLRSAERALTKAVKLRPSDSRLVALSRRVTQASVALETPAHNQGGSKGPALGDLLEGWKLTQILGQGGWGQVFRAERDGHLRALKVLHPELSREPGFEDTFKREILTLHSLGRQPHLVQFDTFGYARPHGYLYFLMELIEGESLQTRLQRSGPLPIEEAVPLFRHLAGEGGLASAHARGVVHRDIKPANILLRAKNSCPVLVDFGLALAGARGLSTINRVTGYTAMFAAPEQLRGKPADARSDIYSLVGSLYYALTLQEPEEFDPSRLPKRLEALAAVFMRALDRRPDNRPPDAAALSEMLSVAEAGAPVDRSVPKSDALSRAAVFPTPATAAPPENWTCRHDCGPTHAVAFSSDGTRVAAAGKSQTLCLWSVGRCSADRGLEGHTDSILSVAFLGDDGQQVLSAGADNTICLWGPESDQPRLVLDGHHSPIHSLSVAPHQRRLAAGDADGIVCLWNLDDGKLIARCEGNGVVYSVAFSPDGTRLLSGDKNGTIRLWDGKSGQLLKTVVKGEGTRSAAIYSVAWSPKDRLVLSGSHDRIVRLWDLNRGKQQRQLKGHGAAVRCVAFSPDGRLIASAGGDKTVRLWEAASGRLLKSFADHRAAVRSIAFSPDGLWLLSGSLDGTVRLRKHSFG